MSFFGWLTDRIILEPTRHVISATRRKALRLDHGREELEIWVHRVGPHGGSRPDLYLLEFPGTASRAEDSTDFVEACWSERSVEIWAVNPPGYGKSTGTASLKKLPAMAKRALDEIRKISDAVPVIVAGGSLGSISALYLAARYPVEGVLVQNPPALRELILAQSAWWHFRWARQLIAAQIPAELDSLANAAKVKAPAVFVTAQQDSVVAASIQQQVIHAYDGPLKVLSLPDADHGTPLGEADLERLRPLASWLYDAAKQ